MECKRSLFTLATLFILFTCGTGKAQQQPVPLAPDATDPVQQLLRKNRSQLFSSPRMRLVEQTPPGSPPNIVFVHKNPMPELPASESDAIVIGEITGAQPYLSADRKMLYTEFTVHVIDLIKSVSEAAADSNDIALVERGGEAVLADGRVFRNEVHGSGSPIEIRQRYALFLHYVPSGTCFRLIKAWNLKDGNAWAMSPDDLNRVHRGVNPYNGMSESVFIESIRRVVATSTK
jgi:hypothetical protein